MDSFVEYALINAVIVIPLALIAEMAGRALRRPVLTHLLWVFVLVKLVTPPLFQIPMIDRVWLSSTVRQIAPSSIVDVERFDRGPLLPRIGDASPVVHKPPSRPRTLAQTNRPPAPRPTTAANIASWVRSEDFRQLVQTGLLVIWALGSLVWFSIQGFRCVQFRRRNRRSECREFSRGRYPASHSRKFRRSWRSIRW